MHGGDINEARLGGGEDGPNFSDELDFSNDTEVHVTLRATSEQTGLEYGASVEFETDTNRTDNTDETFVFVRGGWASCASATRTARPTRVPWALPRSPPVPAGSTAR